MGGTTSSPFRFQEGWIYTITYNKGYWSTAKDAYTIYHSTRKDGTRVFSCVGFEFTSDDDENIDANGLKKSELYKKYKEWFDSIEDDLVLYDSEILKVTPGWDVKGVKQPNNKPWNRNGRGKIVVDILGGNRGEKNLPRLKV